MSDIRLDQIKEAANLIHKSWGEVFTEEKNTIIQSQTDFYKCANMLSVLLLKIDYTTAVDEIKKVSDNNPTALDEVTGRCISSAFRSHDSLRKSMQDISRKSRGLSRIEREQLISQTRRNFEQAQSNMQDTLQKKSEKINELIAENKKLKADLERKTANSDLAKDLLAQNPEAAALVKETNADSEKGGITSNGTTSGETDENECSSEAEMEENQLPLENDQEPLPSAPKGVFFQAADAANINSLSSGEAIDLFVSRIGRDYSDEQIKFFGQKIKEGSDPRILLKIASPDRSVDRMKELLEIYQNEEVIRKKRTRFWFGRRRR